MQGYTFKKILIRTGVVIGIGISLFFVMGFIPYINTSTNPISLWVSSTVIIGYLYLTWAERQDEKNMS
jgi:uncharacterized membrane-anchored protein